MNINKTQFIFMLDLFSYKIYKCKKNNCKSSKNCFNYHNNIDKRRKITKINFYYPKKCNCTYYKGYGDSICKCKNKNKCCCKGDQCEYSHNRYEILYHPFKYKTQLCEKLMDCKYGNYCCNAHSKSELRIELIHHLPFDYSFFIYKFKTEFCPIIKNHLKKKCVYAHNFQEFRRKPNNNSINIKCKRWIKNDNIPNIYKEKCSFNCKYFHGWKEEEFYPKNFKTSYCRVEHKKEQSSQECPNYHNHLDKFLKDKNFLIVPKNYI